MQEKTLTRLEREIFENLDGFVTDKGYNLVDVTLSNVGSQSILSIYVYQQDHMTLNDLAKLSAEIEPVLDGIESLTNSYLLEVTSPGINRTFKHLREFDIFKGQTVKVVTADGKKIIGTNEGLSGENVTIKDGSLLDQKDTDKQDYIININDINKAKLFG